ncbi:MAG: hypothetical protein H0W68_09085 [Gemmatimonadaceae bacterium]|nr:hypothetical protein [Gemmatimonadaceae bacterium]
MRLFRALAMGAALAALLPQAGAAQAGRQFKDAWFWGVKTGGLLYSSASSGGSAAPLIGAEWLITRTKGGLYLSFDQSFLSTRGGFIDRDPDSTSAFLRQVNLKNLRRLTLAAMVFPMQQRTVHPYVGFGFTLNQIGSAALVSSPVNPIRYAIALDSIQSKRTTVSPTLIGGAQFKLRNFSLFAQSTVAPSQQAFFLYSLTGGRAFTASLETGIRYNIGSSIDRAR